MQSMAKNGAIRLVVIMETIASTATRGQNNSFTPRSTNLQNVMICRPIVIVPEDPFAHLLTEILKQSGTMGISIRYCFWNQPFMSLLHNVIIFFMLTICNYYTILYSLGKWNQLGWAIGQCTSVGNQPQLRKGWSNFFWLTWPRGLFFRQSAYAWNGHVWFENELIGG